MTKSSQFLEYMKIHLISVNQDWEDSKNSVPLGEDEYDSIDIEDISLNGQIIATRHLLSVATDIMNNSNERVYE